MMALYEAMHTKFVSGRMSHGCHEQLQYPPKGNVTLACNSSARHLNTHPTSL